MWSLSLSYGTHYHHVMSTGNFRVTRRATSQRQLSATQKLLNATPVGLANTTDQLTIWILSIVSIPTKCPSNLAFTIYISSVRADLHLLSSITSLKLLLLSTISIGSVLSESCHSLLQAHGVRRGNFLISPRLFWSYHRLAFLFSNHPLRLPGSEGLRKGLRDRPQVC